MASQDGRKLFICRYFTLEQIEVFTGSSQCRLHTKKKLSVYLAEVATDEDSDFDKEDNGPEDILEVNFSDHENFSEHCTELEEDGDSGN
ncbi:hypothetical protein AVEN_102685-1 [Araneus ventricosus]|uniref:Uncharacterized protein n=1 Tax=Araneus ventricosus TaxID=182803 RepID=A0A4Y2WYL9_ARAVE|nr:hypothetical protein AVEN_102685-1 [Araneus ventricosus]